MISEVVIGINQRVCVVEINPRRLWKDGTRRWQWIDRLIAGGRNIRDQQGVQLGGSAAQQGEGLGVFGDKVKDLMDIWQQIFEEDKGEDL